MLFWRDLLARGKGVRRARSGKKWTPRLNRKRGERRCTVHEARNSGHRGKPAKGALEECKGGEEMHLAYQLVQSF